MDRMFRLLAFWTGMFSVIFFAGELYVASILFLVQTAFFLTLSYLRLSERMYIYIFGAYLTVFFVGFTYWTTFMMVPGQGTPLAIDDYTWSTDGTRLLIFTNTKKVWRLNTRGDYWVVDLKGGAPRKLGGLRRADC